MWWVFFYTKSMYTFYENQNAIIIFFLINFIMFALYGLLNFELSFWNIAAFSQNVKVLLHPVESSLPPFSEMLASRSYTNIRLR